MIFLIVLVALISSSVCQIEDDECITPSGQLGNCVLFSQCSPLMSLWDRTSASQRFILGQLLRELNCGYNRVEPMVCCVPEVEEPPPIVVNIDNNNSPPDVSRHRNVQMLPTKCGDIERDKISNGNQTGVFEYPWMALLSHRINGSTSFQCGGSVINQRYILTAAHCVTDLGNATLAGVRVGEHNLRTNPDCEGPLNDQDCASPYQDIPIERVIFHPNYTRSVLQNDIALIRLSRPIVNILPICLPTNRELRNTVTDNIRMVVAGWGLTETMNPSDELLQIEIPVVDNMRCGEILNRSLVSGIIRTQICAGGLPGTDACRGDSGGPLKIVQEVNGVQKYVQHGIVSFGPRTCGTTGVPTIYTRLVYFMDWLLDQLQP